MSQHDPTFDLKINVALCDLYFMISDFVFYFEDCLMYEHHYFGLSRYDPTFDLKINVCHCDLYLMVQ